MMKKLAETNRLYIYNIYDGGFGICMADSEEEAKAKVKMSYLQHGYCESELTDIGVVLIQKDDRCFEDDILELTERRWLYDKI